MKRVVLVALVFLAYVPGAEAKQPKPPDAVRDTVWDSMNALAISTSFGQDFSDAPEIDGEWETCRGRGRLWRCPIWVTIPHRDGSATTRCRTVIRANTQRWTWLPERTSCLVEWMPEQLPRND